jgi:hypothetical protein
MKPHGTFSEKIETIQPKYGISSGMENMESTEELIKKMWYIYMMEYYSAINKNKMTLAGKCMESKIIMLSEISQTEKKNIVCFLSYIESRTENNE